MVGFGIRPGLLEVAVTVSVWISLVAPEVMPVRLTACCPASSLMVTLAIASRVGCWLTPLTVTVKERLMVLFWVWPSLTVTVMVQLPKKLGAGVKFREPVVFGLV